MSNQKYELRPNMSLEELQNFKEDIIKEKNLTQTYIGKLENNLENSIKYKNYLNATLHAVNLQIQSATEAKLEDVEEDYEK